MCIHCATHRRSVFLGMPLGTVLKPCAWQSTCEPEQLHLCGHARAATRHSKPHSRANKEPRWSAGSFSRAAGAIVPATVARGKLGNARQKGGGVGGLKKQTNKLTKNIRCLFQSRAQSKIIIIIIKVQVMNLIQF